MIARLGRFAFGRRGIARIAVAIAAAPRAPPSPGVLPPSELLLSLGLSPDDEPCLSLPPWPFSCPEPLLLSPSSPSLRSPSGLPSEPLPDFGDPLSAGPSGWPAFSSASPALSRASGSAASFSMRCSRRFASSRCRRIFALQFFGQILNLLRRGVARLSDGVRLALALTRGIVFLFAGGRFSAVLGGWRALGRRIALLSLRFAVVLALALATVGRPCPSGRRPSRAGFAVLCRR